MKLANAKEVIEFTETAEKSSESMRQQLAERQGIDGCYYEGVQWIHRWFGVGINRSSSSISRLPVDWNPDSRKLRTIENETSRLTQKAWAATDPSQIYMRVEPPDRDTGPDAAYRARVQEAAVNAAIDASQYLTAAQWCNRRRCIFGTRLLGLSIEHSQEGSYVCAFEGDTTGLILDPACQRPFLHEHPYVCYTDVWTLDRIKSVFGVELDPAKCKTFEQLDPQKIEINSLSQNRLFSRYARYSQSKGARVYQLHTRDGPYRFGDWFVMIEDGTGKKELVNEDSTQTPFGGAGMPFTMLHGYPRADTMWSWGEPAQIKDDQDKANLRGTMRERIHQQYAHARPIVDRRWFGMQSGNDDSIINSYFTNQIGLPIIGTGSDRNRNAMPPAYLQMPPPPPFLDNDIQTLRNTMREKTHKAPGNFGESKSHVPDATNQRVLDDAGQVASVRLDGDMRAHDYLIKVLHATTIKLVQERNTPTVAMLRAAGFDSQDFAVLLQTDHQHPGVSMSVRSGSFRNISVEARKQNLDTAASMGMLDAESYQEAMADTLQLPLTEEARQMTDQCKKLAIRIIYGEEWPGKPMGKWNKLLIATLVRSQFDPRALQDPAAAQRLVRALQSQYKMQYQEMMLANPELMQSAQPEQPPADGGATEGPQEGDSVSVADVISDLSRRGGAGVSAQPATAA